MVHKRRGRGMDNKKEINQIPVGIKLIGILCKWYGGFFTFFASIGILLTLFFPKFLPNFISNELTPFIVPLLI
jgi:hypothetical protein